MNITTNEWHGCYRQRWTGIVPETFSHPAKFAPGLILRIYRHALDRGYIQPGDHVLDMFAGVGLGALLAMRHGMHWVGVELEQKFVDIGTSNIKLWNSRFVGRLPLWGTAVLLQGDSRQLSRITTEHFTASVTSPPYVNSMRQRPIADDVDRRAERKAAAGLDLDKSRNVGGPHSVLRQPQSYGDAPGQLGAMPEGQFDAAVSSPPFLSSTGSDDPDKRGGLYRDPKRRHDVNLTSTYGKSDGQLGAMPEGPFDATISSPPYSTSNQDYEDGWKHIDKDKLVHSRGSQQRDASYGESDGQLGTMSEGQFNATISSPPYEDSLDRGRVDPAARRLLARQTNSTAEIVSPIDMEKVDQRTQDNYGTSAGQLGLEQGNTFWSAAHQIVEETYRVLAPGGLAVWVCKDFVRNKKRVPFARQWRQLCEACGFETLEKSRAWMVEKRGTQTGFFDNVDLTIQRKSFFRLLAERKGSPPIDWEVVWFMRKADH